MLGRSFCTFNNILLFLLRSYFWSQTIEYSMKRLISLLLILFFYCACIIFAICLIASYVQISGRHIYKRWRFYDTPHMYGPCEGMQLFYILICIWIRYLPQWLMRQVLSLKWSARNRIICCPRIFFLECWLHGNLSGCFEGRTILWKGSCT